MIGVSDVITVHPPAVAVTLPQVPTLWNGPFDVSIRTSVSHHAGDELVLVRKQDARHPAEIRSVCPLLYSALLL